MAQEINRESDQERTAEARREWNSRLQWLSDSHRVAPHYCTEYPLGQSHPGGEEKPCLGTNAMSAKRDQCNEHATGGGEEQKPE
jgi:hypothetical protein